MAHWYTDLQETESPHQGRRSKRWSLARQASLQVDHLGYMDIF